MKRSSITSPSCRCMGQGMGGGELGIGMVFLIQSYYDAAEVQ